MTFWKITLSYDGTAFHGWQVQPGRSTVQGMLAAALEQMTGERVLPQGSGRTDAGVHALGQVASFGLEAPIPAENLLRAMNRVLPPSIRVLEAERVPASFHARHRAVRKTYEYRIFERRVLAGARESGGGESGCGELGCGAGVFAVCGSVCVGLPVGVADGTDAGGGGDAVRDARLQLVCGQ